MAIEVDLESMKKTEVHDLFPKLTGKMCVVRVGKTG